MYSQEETCSTHFFIYKDQKYGFNIHLFAFRSEYIEKKLIDLLNQKEINLLINEKDSDVPLSKDSINSFISFCHKQDNNINNENVIQLNYLATEYKVSSLFNCTEAYIRQHQSELGLQCFSFYKNFKNINNEKNEELLSTYLLFNINNDQLLELPVQSLYRIISLFLKKNANAGETERKKIYNDLTPFLFKCLDKYGRKASVLFMDIDLLYIDHEHVNQLIHKYSDKFDYHYINSLMLKTNYDLQNEFIQKEQRINFNEEQNKNEIQKLKQENNSLRDIIIKQKQDIKDIIESKNQEIISLINNIKNDFQQKYSDLQNENIQINKTNEQLKIRVENLEKEIQSHKQEIANNNNKQIQDINTRFNIEIPKINEKINDIQNKIQQQVNNLQNQCSQNISRTEMNQKLNSIQNDMTSLDNKCPKTFAYDNNNHFSGIINYLLAKSNNQIENLMSINSSSTDSECENPIYVTLFNDTSKYFKSEDKQNSWISFDFKNHRIIPTDYTIKSFSADQNGNHPRNWVIEASNDNINWETIDEQNNCSILRGRSIVHTFKVKNQQWKQFKYLRMRQTASNWHSWDSLIIDSFEIFGQYI